VTFVADESVDKQIVEAVRGLGYYVLSIAETAPGIADEEVLNRSRNARSVLLTGDKDFGELVFRQQRLHAGIILLRLAGLAPAEKAAIVTAAIESHANELEAGFCVLTDKVVRIRRSGQ
jgi:predicted nuclease of predicted toxin-antitoxin system